MSGVTILNTFKDVEYHFGWWNFSAIFLIAATIAIAFIIILHIYRKYMEDRGEHLNKKRFKMTVCLFEIIALAMIITGLITCHFAHKTIHYNYQVLVNDEVNFNDFMERYYIIDKQGITYIVRNDAESYSVR